jgi:hypothetical protein
MELAITLIIIVLLAAASLVAGVDSRPNDTRDRQDWWPGTRR